MTLEELKTWMKVSALCKCHHTDDATYTASHLGDLSQCDFCEGIQSATLCFIDMLEQVDG